MRKWLAGVLSATGARLIRWADQIWPPYPQRM